MCFDDETMQSIADREPVLAFLLATTPYREPMTLVCTAEFSNGAVDTVEAATLGASAPEDYYIFDSSYQVETPSANAGSLWKGQQDVFNAEGPNIWTQTLMTGAILTPQYLVNYQRGPIEGIYRWVHSETGGVCSPKRGWTLRYGQNIQVSCQLKRVYQTSSGEIPLRVSFFLQTMRLGCQSPWRIPVGEAIEGLTGLGIKPSASARAPRREPSF